GERVARLLQDSDVIVREKAATALAELGARDQAPALRTALAKERNPLRRATMVSALGKIGIPADVRPFLTSSDAYVRSAAIAALGDLQSREDLDRIVGFLDARDGREQAAAAYAIGRLGSRKHIPLLARKAEEHEALAMSLVHLLADIGGEE